MYPADLSFIQIKKTIKIMKKKSNLKLDGLKVESFVTSEVSKEEMDKMNGGNTTWTIYSIEWSVDSCLVTNPVGPTKGCQVA